MGQGQAEKGEEEENQGLGYWKKACSVHNDDGDDNDDDDVGSNDSSDDDNNDDIGFLSSYSYCRLPEGDFDVSKGMRQRHFIPVHTHKEKSFAPSLASYED